MSLVPRVTAGGMRGAGLRSHGLAIAGSPATVPPLLDTTEPEPRALICGAGEGVGDAGAIAATLLSSGGITMLGTPRLLG
mmetsp:Transcript_8508/g.17254  ORF Transcript_8508/g.17254 Transcript_8508/m.17254 type:complete len:80 (-) Transcript_8508:344-583(-)